MKILVLSTNYPSAANPSVLRYIHTRNIYYIYHGLDVTVLNFSTKTNYVQDGINVISLQSYSKEKNHYDILVSHAPNLRNHLTFLRKFNERFPRIVFFFHGHEVLMRSKVYSKPYPYVKKSFSLLDDIYDWVKLRIWRTYFKKWLNKSTFVFVSNWMLSEFEKWVGVSRIELSGRYHIIYNCVGHLFETNDYDYKSPKKYDFISIRPNFDVSKYSVDVINNLAKNNPKYTFLLIGKGEFFKHYEKASNLTCINEYLNHEQIFHYLNQARCALIPTRTDAQGVMMCEMATFGIPVITSDIPVCHEVFSSFKNVRFIDNEMPSCNDLPKLLQELLKGLPYMKNQTYFEINTSGKEIALYKSVI